MATLALPSPVEVKTLLRREEKVPYVIENGCEKYAKMLNAVKAARQLANVAVRQVSVRFSMFALYLLTMIKWWEYVFMFRFFFFTETYMVAV